MCAAIHKHIGGVGCVKDCMLGVHRQNRVSHNQSELENHTKKKKILRHSRHLVFTEVLSGENLGSDGSSSQTHARLHRDKEPPDGRKKQLSRAFEEASNPKLKGESRIGFAELRAIYLAAVFKF